MEGSERDWKGEVGRFRKGLVRRRSNLKRKGASRGNSWFDGRERGKLCREGGGMMEGMGGLWNAGETQRGN